MADMDNDGLLDIVASNTRDKNVPDDTSNVFMYRNIGTATNPVFDEAEILTLENGDKIPSNYAIRLGVGDIDNDGIMDLIINGSTDYPGKAMVFLGKLKQTENGNIKYSVKKSSFELNVNGSMVTLNGMTELKVRNVSGRVLASQRVGQKKTIDLKELNLKSGLHILEAKKGNQIISHKYIGR